MSADGYLNTMEISIHSLVKRETRRENPLENHKGISIHSLVKRETHICTQKGLGTNYFNPLPRKEGDE